MPGASNDKDKQLAGYRWDLVCLGAWVFEIFTAVLSVVDVASDILVAKQFYREEHRGWFWMVVASMLMSNVAYCIFGSRAIVRDRWRFRFGKQTLLDGMAVVVVGFVIGQAYPLLLWYYELKDAHFRNGAAAGWRAIVDTIRIPVDCQGRDLTRRQTTASLPVQGKASDTEDTSSDGEGEPGFMVREDSWAARADGDDTTATREALGDEEDARRFVKRMTASLDAHMKSNFGFYVETVTEAIPQALIQLLAMSATGEATPLQLLSMTLSLVSIVSKAYVVSVSFDLRAVAFKAALVVADVASLFYVFSTLVAFNAKPDTVFAAIVPRILGIEGSAGGSEGLRVEDSSIPGLVWVPLHVTALSAMWLRIASVFVVFAFAVALNVMFGIFLIEIRDARTRTVKGLKFVCAALAVICMFPAAAIALTGMKLSVLLLPLHFKLSPPKGTMAFFAIAYSFYSRGVAKGGAGGEERLRHVLHFTVDYITDHRAPRAPPARRTIAHARQAMRAALHRLIDRSECLGIRGYRRPVIEGAPADVKKSVWRRINDEYEKEGLFKTVHQGTAWVLLAASFVSLATLGALSLAFPFLHVASVGVGALNVLQASCLVLATTSTLVAARYGRFMYRFVTFTYLLKELGPALDVITPTATNSEKGYPSTAADAAKCIAAYFLPPQVAVLKAAVPVAVLPHDVTEEVADFLRMGDLDTSRLSAAQCDALNDRASRDDA